MPNLELETRNKTQNESWHTTPPDIQTQAPTKINNKSNPHPRNVHVKQKRRNKYSQEY